MKRGEIYYIKSSYSESGFEIKGSRPGVIVSNDRNNASSGCLEVVFMTTQPKKNLPTHVLVRQDTARPSTVLCEQITTVDIGRFSDYMGTLTEEEMLEVDKALAISLGLNLTEAVKTEVTEEEEQGDCLGCEEFHRMQRELEATKSIYNEFQRVQAERNVYQQLYRELLEKVAR